MIMYVNTIRGQSSSAWEIARLDTIVSSLPENCTSCPEAIPLGLATHGSTIYMSYKDKLNDKAKKAKTFLIKSEDNGVTWSAPITSVDDIVYRDPKIDVLEDNSGNMKENLSVWGRITKIPGSENLIFIVNKIGFPGTDLRESEVFLWEYNPNNDSWNYLTALDIPRCNGTLTTLTGITDGIVQFPNGDLAIPAITTQWGSCIDSGYETGLGYFLSQDNGQTWSRLKANFKEVDVGNYVDPNTNNPYFAYYEGTDQNPKLQFNEVTMTSKETPSGRILYAYMRPNFHHFDNENDGYGAEYVKGSNSVISGLIWQTTSTDNGNTWSTPIPLDLGSYTDGINNINSVVNLDIAYLEGESHTLTDKHLKTNLLALPQIVKLNNDEFIMFGGRLNTINRRITFFESTDAERFNTIGETSYLGLGNTPTPLLPLGNGREPLIHGGNQKIIELPNGDIYAIYYQSAMINAGASNHARVEIYGLTLTKIRSCINDNITLSLPIDEDKKYLTDASISTTGTNKIINSSNVIYDANNIKLNTGFKVEIGSTFKAINTKCK